MEERKRKLTEEEKEKIRKMARIPDFKTTPPAPKKVHERDDYYDKKENMK